MVYFFGMIFYNECNGEVEYDGYGIFILLDGIIYENVLRMIICLEIIVFLIIEIQYVWMLFGQFILFMVYIFDDDDELSFFIYYFKKNSIIVMSFFVNVDLGF